MKTARITLLTAVILGGLIAGALPAHAADDIVIDGAGWGHGVGLSQYGAKGQADGGKTAEQILTYYYSGTSVVDVGTVIPGSWMLAEPEPLWVNLLYNRSSTTVTAKDGALTICQNEPSGLVLREGDVSHWVFQLETSLVGTGHFTDTPDDIFDAATKTAVIAYQTANALTPDGIVGSQTRSNLWPTDADGENCALELSLTAGANATLTAGPNSSCTWSLAPVEGSCIGSVRGLSPTSRVAVSGKFYGNSTQEYAHGTIRLRPKTTGFFHVIIQIGIEDYIAGISEVPISWPNASLETQAIAARSYGINRSLLRGPQPGFSSSVRGACWCHLYSTTLSQVYAGWLREQDFGGRWSTLARGTNGKVVRHPSYGVIAAFYSSSTGGYTENNEEVWGGSALPYLRSVADPWSLDSRINPNHSWTRTFSPADVASALGFASVHRVYVSARNTSGSARTVVVSGVKSDAVKTTSYTGGTFRSKLGLKSQFFSVDWTGPLPALAGADQVVLHDPSSGKWLYRAFDTTISSIYYGVPGDYGFFGDWDCDGVDTPGLYRRSDGFVYLRNSNTQGVADVSYFFGIPGDLPLAGDFNGNGCDTVSIYRPSEARFYVINQLGSADAGLGAADYSFLYGVVGDDPFVGDWTGDGIDTPGLRRDSDGFVYLRNTNTQGVANVDFFYGVNGDVVFAGDWDADGDDTLGLYRPSNGTVYLRNTNTTGIADFFYAMGGSVHRAVAGGY
ncbi:MAG: SpoIID/LytB domain-containing protein [Acidobacteria bacterium]|nr:SpoIID/LytB domain-containing protein [Acidobacteriota bacterium]